MPKKGSARKGRRAPQKPDCLTPSRSVLSKLALTALHFDELINLVGHHLRFDKTELQKACDDPELKDWLKQMEAMLLIPKKRM